MFRVIIPAPIQQRPDGTGNVWNPIVEIGETNLLTCLHCGEPVDHLQGVWFHPYRRFAGHHGDLPTLCDFGDRVGPTHASPTTLTSSDRDFLWSIRVAADEENFLLETLRD
jgi:hypothetical protein